MKQNRPDSKFTDTLGTTTEDAVSQINQVCQGGTAVCQPLGGSSRGEQGTGNQLGDGNYSCCAWTDPVVLDSRASRWGISPSQMKSSCVLGRVCGHGLSGDGQTSRFSILRGFSSVSRDGIDPPGLPTCGEPEQEKRKMRTARKGRCKYSLKAVVNPKTKCLYTAIYQSLDVVAASGFFFYFSLFSFT